jgi:putative oxidoreductase
MAAHGGRKLFGWFGGPGLRRTGASFQDIGFRPPVAMAATAGAGELACGLLVALGFLGPVGPASMMSIMIVAMITVHWSNGVFASDNGVELPLMYAIAAFTFAFTGFGEFSLDNALGITNTMSALTTVVIVGVGAIAGVVNAMIARLGSAAESVDMNDGASVRSHAKEAR